MDDSSIILKKENGESLIMNPDDTVEVVDADGIVKGKQDFRFKISQDLRGKAIATDNTNQSSFTVGPNAIIRRIGGVI